MARYEINYRCGHTGEVQLYGKNADREKEIKRLEKDLCPECFKTWIRNRNAEEAKEILGDIVLPELEGTEKQIEYAKDLRNEYIAKDGRVVVSNRYVFNDEGELVPAWVEMGNDFVRRLNRFLNGMTYNDEARCQYLCKKLGMKKGVWQKAVTCTAPKAYACLSETNAGKLIKILRDPMPDKWLPECDERAIYTTPERLISKYDLQLEGDKIRANKKVDDDEQIAISMLAEEIIEKLKTKEEK